MTNPVMTKHIQATNIRVPVELYNDILRIQLARAIKSGTKRPTLNDLYVEFLEAGIEAEKSKMNGDARENA